MSQEKEEGRKERREYAVCRKRVLEENEALSRESLYYIGGLSVGNLPISPVRYYMRVT